MQIVQDSRRSRVTSLGGQCSQRAASNSTIIATGVQIAVSRCVCCLSDGEACQKGYVHVPWRPATIALPPILSHADWPRHPVHTSSRQSIRSNGIDIGCYEIRTFVGPRCSQKYHTAAGGPRQPSPRHADTTSRRLHGVLVLARDGRAGVVLVSPDPVPECGDARGGDEDGRRVVDGRGGDGEGGGHAEQRQSQEGPSCRQVSRGQNTSAASGTREEQSRGKRRGGGDIPMATTFKR